MNAIIKKAILVVGVVCAVIIAYFSGQKSAMSHLQHQLNQRIVNDIMLLQEDISDVNRSKDLSTDISIIDLGSIRLHAGALYSHLQGDYISNNWIASEFTDSFNYLYHLSWYMATKTHSDLLGAEFQRFSSPLTSLNVGCENNIRTVLQQLEDELLSESARKLLEELILSK